MYLGPTCAACFCCVATLGVHNRHLPGDVATASLLLLYIFMLPGSAFL